MFELSRNKFVNMTKGHWHNQSLKYVNKNRLFPKYSNIVIDSQNLSLNFSHLKLFQKGLNQIKCNSVRHLLNTFVKIILTVSSVTICAVLIGPRCSTCEV